MTRKSHILYTLCQDYKTRQSILQPQNKSHKDRRMDLKGKENKTTGFVVHTCNFSTQEAEDSKAKASLGQPGPAWAIGYTQQGPILRPEGGKGGKGEEGPVASPALLASLSTA